MQNNTVKTDSDSTDVRLLQTSSAVLTLETMLDTSDRSRSWPLLACLCSCDGHLADRTAVVASWLHNHAGHQPSPRSVGIIAKDAGNSLKLSSVIAPAFVWLCH